ncbi:MAG: hypothetical protein RLZZ283_275 [Candidatus Parcubacteria bacterium]|jgi:prolyl-tRNA synthetase
MAQQKRDLPLKSEGLSEWYNKIVLQAELADYGPARGTIIYRPYGYAIWELVQQEMDKRIKEKGVSNAYFPLLIPESLLKKEASHIEGFSPELAVVTIGGGEELEEKLIVRPTSETIMYDAYARWIQSWRDLPLMINQWNNVVRWEKRTNIFLRGLEFLWQEGHTAHATHEESSAMQRWAIDMYASVYRDYFALPGYIGWKSQSEKFAGADSSLTYESLMPEGKALQSCTSHDLGQNFSKTFNIAFQSESGGSEFAWQTSWGFSTRAIGGLVMAHGDDGGLVLPPKLAPIQVVIIPIRLEGDKLLQVEKIAQELKAQGVRVKLDTRENASLGSKINEWELKGVPVRLEIGGKELDAGAITAARRDTSEKSSIPLNNVVSGVQGLLSAMQENLLAKADAFLAANTFSADSYDEFKKILESSRGFIRAHWCEDASCEAAIKEETKATTRCLPIDAPEESGVCVRCGKASKHRWIFGIAY